MMNDGEDGDGRGSSGSTSTGGAPILAALRGGPASFAAAPTTDPVALMAQQYQVHLNVERLRVPEAYFRPITVGVDQAGVSEVLAATLAAYPASLRVQLAQNVFVTGGGSRLTGYASRLARELRQLQPADLPVRLWTAQDAHLDAWRGGARWTASPAFAASLLTREEYEERGHDHLIEHLLSNVYYPTPPPPQAAPTPDLAEPDPPGMAADD